MKGTELKLVLDNGSQISGVVIGLEKVLLSLFTLSLSLSLFSLLSSLSLFSLSLSLSPIRQQHNTSTRYRVWQIASRCTCCPCWLMASQLSSWTLQEWKRSPFATSYSETISTTSSTSCCKQRRKISNLLLVSLTPSIVFFRSYFSRFVPPFSFFSRSLIIFFISFH